MSTVEARPGRTQPATGTASAPFWDATREQRLVIQHCDSCGRPVWYPRTFCPHCGSVELTWRDASGRGEIHTFTVEHKPAAAFGTEPYVIALVELDEGVRLMANVVGCAPGEVTVGMPVEVVWEPLEDGRHLPLFRPAGEGER